jgi:cobalt-zinc-cadmium efflux system membrane fusion protein
MTDPKFLKITNVLLCGLLLVGCGKPPEAPVEKTELKDGLLRIPAKDPRLGSFSLGKVENRPAVTVRWFGKLEWDEDSTVRIFPSATGRVTQVLAKPGDRVQEGAPLALVSSPDYSQAVAEQSKAEADLALSEKTLRRTRELLALGAVAAKDLEAAEADHLQKDAEARRTRDHLVSLNVRTGDVAGTYALRAPISGTVVDMVINRGQELRFEYVQANFTRISAPLFTISNPDRLRLTLEVPEEKLGECRIGSKVVVRTRSGAEQANATITSIDSDLDAATGHGRVRCVVDNKAGGMRAGMVVRAEFTLASNHRAGFLVPAVAVVGAEGQRRIYVRETSGGFRRMEVGAAEGEAPEGFAAVLGDLRPGQEVVTQGSLLLDATYQESAGQ